VEKGSTSAQTRRIIFYTISETISACKSGVSLWYSSFVISSSAASDVFSSGCVNKSASDSSEHVRRSEVARIDR